MLPWRPGEGTSAWEPARVARQDQLGHPRQHLADQTRVRLDHITQVEGVVHDIRPASGHIGGFENPGPADFEETASPSGERKAGRDVVPRQGVEYDVDTCPVCQLHHLAHIVERAANP